MSLFIDSDIVYAWHSVRDQPNQVRKLALWIEFPKLTCLRDNCTGNAKSTKPGTTHTLRQAANYEVAGEALNNGVAKPVNDFVVQLRDPGRMFRSIHDRFDA